MSEDVEKSANKGHRRSRESFKKTLTKILKRADTRQVHEVTWKRFPWSDEPDASCKFVLNSIWVVGSFARGAISCGDLDLVVEIEILSGLNEPPTTKIIKSSIGSFPDLSVFLGTPDSNSSQVAFPEAVLLWSKEDARLIWKKTIESIPVDTNATRFSREYDRLPFRKEQICGGDLEAIERIIDALKRKEMIAQWVTMEELAGITHDPRSESLLSRLIRWQCGEKTAKIFQIVIPWLSANTAETGWEPEHDTTELWVGGYRLHTGRSPYVPLDWLDRLAFSAVCVMPHITRRGPNGLWILRRGPRHQLVKLFEGADVNVMCDVSGTPRQRFFFSEDMYPKVRTGIHICKKSGKTTRPFTGSELLILLSQVGSVSIGGKVFPVNSYRYEKGYDDRIMNAIGLKINSVVTNLS